MAASGVVFTAFLTLSKLQSAHYDPGFLAFWRAAIALMITLPIIFQQGLGILRVRQPGMIFVRSAFGTLGFILSFYAVSDAVGLPLSEFNAISFSRSSRPSSFAKRSGGIAGAPRWRDLSACS